MQKSQLLSQRLQINNKILLPEGNYDVYITAEMHWLFWKNMALDFVLLCVQVCTCFVCLLMHMCETRLDICLVLI